MKCFPRFLLSLFVALSSFGLYAADKATIAVLPFTIPPTVNVEINNTVIRAERLESEFSDQLLEQLVKSRKFRVLERAHIRKVLRENELTESEYVKAGEAERIGKLLVADYLVIGHIDRIDIRVERRNIQITGETAERVRGTFKLHFRVVSSESGEVVSAQTSKRELDSRDIPIAERRDWTMADYRDRLFSRTALEAGNRILAGIYPVKVASASERELVLNRGEGMGIEIGDRFEVYAQGTSIKDPDTGDIIGNEEVLLGVIEVSTIEPKLSRARIIQAYGQIPVGSICRPGLADEVEREDIATPRVTPGW